MALLPPYDFNDEPPWWARHDLMWWDDDTHLIHRPTEDRVFMRIMLKEWALREGHYFDLLSPEEQQLHLIERWLIYYQPMLLNTLARARWVNRVLYQDKSVAHIIAVWDTIDEVLYHYAYDKLSLSGMMYEVWHEHQ